MAVLTEPGRRVMKGEAPARLLLPSLTTTRLPGTASKSGPRPTRGPATNTDEVVLDAAGLALFPAPPRPFAWSSPAATACRPTSSPATAACATSRCCAPARARQLLLAHGIGPAKADKYGAELLAVIAQHAGSPP